MWHWLLRYVIIGPIVRQIVRAEVRGYGNIPKRGPYILAIGSHKTEVESIVIPAYLRRHQLYFYAKAEYWRMHRIIGWFMTSIGQIPMERGNPRKALDAIRAGVDILKAGKVLAVYPEGTRSPDNCLHGAYLGTVRTAIDAGGDVPIVPVGLIGMEKASPSGAGLWPRHAKVKIVIGRPIYLPSKVQRAIKLNQRYDKAETTRVYSEIMMYEIASLCNKPYRKARLPIH